MSNSEEKTKSESTIWVQCENPMCMKWRKIVKDFCDDFTGVSWFCHMNPHSDFNDCEKPQERMKVPRGETVVYSELSKGELVWAKMSSYPRWPGVISADPVEEDGVHVAHYNDGTGDPQYYHIEFLGEPRSHAWITARNVHKYNTASADLIFEHKSMKRKKMRLQLQKAMREASQFVKQTHIHRQQMCFYKFVQPNVSASLPPKRGRKQKVCMAEVKPSQILKPVQILKVGSDGKLPNHNSSSELFISLNGKVYPMVLAKAADISSPPLLQTSLNVNKNQPSIIGSNSRKQQKHCVAVEALKVTKEGKENSPPVSVKKNTSKKVKENFSSVTQPLKKMKFSFARETPLQESVVPSTLLEDQINVCASKGQDALLTKDSQEHRFWDDYTAFCARRNMNTHIESVTWYNRKICLHKFFGKVQSMGGYKKATSHWKIWRNICWSLLDSRVDSQFLSLKKAYRQLVAQLSKILLPFEKSLHQKTVKQNAGNISPSMCFTTEKLKQLNRCLSLDQSPEYFPTNTGNTIGSPFQIVPSLPGAALLGKASEMNDVLKGVFSLSSLKSSNPNSPSFIQQVVPRKNGILPSHPPPSSTILNSISHSQSLMRSSPALAISQTFTPSSACTTISDIGLDVAKDNLDELENGDLNLIKNAAHSIDESVPLLDRQSEAEKNVSDKPKGSYEPIIGSQNVDELNDVLGELNDLDETLLEMTGDILFSNMTCL